MAKKKPTKRKKISTAESINTGATSTGRKSRRSSATTSGTSPKPARAKSKKPKKVSATERARQSFNRTIDRLKKKGVSESLLPAKLKTSETKNLYYAEVDKMRRILQKAKFNEDTVHMGTSMGTPMAYADETLDITNIRIRGENRRRQKGRRAIAELNVYQTLQTSSEAVEGVDVYESVEVGSRHEMADLKKEGLRDLKEITTERGPGEVAAYIRARQKSFDRDEAELYKENLIDSLVWTLGDNDSYELVDAIRNTDADVLLYMYYADVDLDIPDWYTKEGGLTPESADNIKKNANILQGWARRLDDTGMFKKSQYSALLNIYDTIYSSDEGRSYNSPNVKDYEARRKRIEGKGS